MTPGSPSRGVFSWQQGGGRGINSQRPSQTARAMRLSTILIHGFKSFADKAEVQVFPGVTCVVGPNGCGKSNVADAVRWALGEQSPKTLRGHKMEDVIFHGTSARKSIGMAEVSLVFHNDGQLEVPWSEVAILVRANRDAEPFLRALNMREIPWRFSGNQGLPTTLNGFGGAIASDSRADIAITDTRIFNNTVIVPNTGLLLAELLISPKMTNNFSFMKINPPISL